MTIDEVIQIIDEAEPGNAHEAAKAAIEQLSEDDKIMAGGDLESNAILRDEIYLLRQNANQCSRGQPT